MIETKLGLRYARSIYDLACEKGQLAEVMADFNAISKVCAANRDFVAMLNSPLINGDKKAAIIRKIFTLSTITDKLLDVIIRKGRERFLDDIAICFREIYDQDHKITRCTLTTAEPATPEFVGQVSAFVETKTGTAAEIEVKTDKSLIGGFVLRFGDNLFDGSIRATLRRLKQEFEDNPYIILQ